MFNVLNPYIIGLSGYIRNSMKELKIPSEASMGNWKLNNKTTEYEKSSLEIKVQYNVPQFGRGYYIKTSMIHAEINEVLYNRIK